MCCVCVCVLCARIYIVLLYTFCSLLWCISKKNFETGTRGKSTKLRIKFHHIRPHISMPQIQYSEKYYDDVYEYRYAFFLLRENVRSELGLRGRICPENAER